MEENVLMRLKIREVLYRIDVLEKKVAQLEKEEE